MPVWQLSWIIPSWEIKYVSYLQFLWTNVRQIIGLFTRISISACPEVIWGGIFKCARVVVSNPALECNLTLMQNT